MISDSLKEYMHKHSKTDSPFLSKVTQETYANIELAQMICGPLVGNLLKFLVRISDAKLVLDVGTFVGFSALTLAEAMDVGGKVITCENNEIHFEIAKKNIKAHPNGNKVELFFGDALDCINSVQELLDLSFLDANKKDSIDQYNLLVEKTRPGKAIVVDDALWKGEIIEMSEPKHLIMDELNKFILKDPRVENVLIPLRNGINLVYKLKS